MDDSQKKVLWKAQIQENYYGSCFLRVIFTDQLMEALAYEQQTDCFNEILRTSKVYDFANVRFEPTEMPLQVLCSIRSEFYISFNSRTLLKILGRRIGLPICPRRFLDYQEMLHARPQIKCWLMLSDW